MTRELTPQRIDRIAHQFDRYAEHYASEGIDRRTVLRMIGVGTAAATVSTALLSAGKISAAEASLITNTSRAMAMQDASPAPTAGGEIIIATLGEAQTLNPLLVNETEGTFRCKMLYDQLIELDPKTLVARPAIAKEWTISDDGLVYTFMLNDNVVFSDGTPLTSADIVFTVESLLTKAVASPHVDPYLMLKGGRDFYDGKADTVAGVKAVDDLTVEFTLDGPNGAWLTTLVTIRPLPKHLLEGKDLTNDPFFQAPVGAGAYKFSSWEIGQDYVGERNEHYYREGQPYLDKFTHRVRADGQALFMEVQSSSIDCTEFVPATQAADVEALGGYVVEIKPPGYDINGWNFGAKNNEKLADKRVRRAIAMAIETEIFVSDFLLGLGRVAKGPVPEGHWAVKDDLAPIPYDPEGAQKLFEEAGVTEMTLRLTCNAGNKFREDWVTFTQQALEPYGITCEPDIKEWAQVVEDGTSGKFEAISPTFATMAVDPDELYGNLHTGEPQNMSGYSNEEVDQLFEEGRAEPDQEKRKEIYGRLQEILLEEVPVYWAWDRPFIIVIRDTFAGYTNTVLSFPSTLPEWYIKS